MKRILGIAAFFAVCSLLLPFVGVWIGQLWQTDGSSPYSGSPTLTASPAPTAPASSQSIPVFITDSQTVEQVPLEEFVLGSVASEMPITWPDEALKAQAIASRSYALARVKLNDGSDESLQGAAFSASPKQHLGFVRTEQMQQMWGSEYEQNYARLKSLVESTAGMVLQYNGDTALACYHAISAGHTEASENVWATALPYLAGVDSSLDMTSPDYEVSTEMTSQEVYYALQMAFPDLELDGDPVDWFGEPLLTDAGYIETLPVGSAFLKGTDVRTALGLRSACFTVTYADGVFTFTTKGYGHGVGMSQYGAYTLALTGKTYDAILAAYYPSTSIVSQS